MFDASIIAAPWSGTKRYNEAKLLYHMIMQEIRQCSKRSYSHLRDNLGKACPSLVVPLVKD